MSTLIKTLLLVLSEFFHFIFPRSNDEILIQDLTTENMPRKLQVRHLDGATILSDFSDPQIRALVHLVKFHRHHKAILLLASLLEIWLKRRHGTSAVIVPIPLSRQRLRERGYNQSELIVRAAVAQLENYKIDTSLLHRSKDTRPQTSLRRADRLANMQGAFTVTHGARSLVDTDVIIIDDVLTTGATLRAAAVALKPLGPRSVTCVAVAH